MLTELQGKRRKKNPNKQVATQIEHLKAQISQQSKQPYDNRDAARDVAGPKMCATAALR